MKVFLGGLLEDDVDLKNEILAIDFENIEIVFPSRKQLRLDKEVYDDVYNMLTSDFTVFIDNGDIANYESRLVQKLSKQNFKQFVCIKDAKRFLISLDKHQS